MLFSVNWKVNKFAFCMLKLIHLFTFYDLVLQETHTKANKNKYLHTVIDIDTIIDIDIDEFNAC